MPAMKSAREVIARLDLRPHPEGGWFREVHRSPDPVDTPHGARAAITSIYFLLEAGQVSRWHVVASDEIWHHHHGAPLELLAYQPDSGEFRRRVLGSPRDAQEPIGIVPAGVWQAARSQGGFSLMGCDVGPGFDFADFRFVADLTDHDTHFTGERARWLELL
jgi:predicted cupin superfamily sugar epimerase